MNATRRFTRNSLFCKAHAFKFGHPLQPIANLSFVCSIFSEFSYQNRFCLQISHPAILFTMLKGFLNCGRFIFHILLLGTRKAFTFSVFLPEASVHIVLLGTQQIISLFLMSAATLDCNQECNSNVFSPTLGKVGGGGVLLGSHIV